MSIFDMLSQSKIEEGIRFDAKTEVDMPRVAVLGIG